MLNEPLEKALLKEPTEAESDETASNATQKPDLDNVEKIVVNANELPVKRKLVFGEHLTPDLARERASPNSLQKKRKKEDESAIMNKRRSTLSGEDCYALLREKQKQSPAPEDPQHGPSHSPQGSALRRLMEARERASSTPPLKSKGPRKTPKITPARQLSGQRNIIQMLSSKIKKAEADESKTIGDKDIDANGEGSEFKTSEKPDKNFA